MRNYSHSKSIVPGGWHWFFLAVILFGYATLNRGFAYIGWYPVFVGEVVLLFYLLTLNHPRLLPLFLGTSVGKVWVIFFLYNFIIFLFSLRINPDEAIRNSVYWVYSIFLYFGFIWGRHLVLITGGVRNFERMLLFVALANLIYLLLFPLREVLRDATAFLYSGTALVGYYSTYHASSVPLIFYILFYAKYNQQSGWKQSALYNISIIGMFLILILTEARASFLEFFISMLLMLTMFRSVFEKIAWRILVAGWVAVIIVLAFDVSYEGSRGKTSVVVASIFSESTDDESLRGTRQHRLQMWENVLGRATSTLETSIFGLGFSELLIDRATGIDTILRYPHNSYVSVIGFTGLMGLVWFLLLQVILIKYAWNYGKTGLQSALVKWYPFLPIGMSIGAFFGTAFEAPFHSFIYYLLSGLMTGIVYAEKNLLKKGGIA